MRITKRHYHDQQQQQQQLQPQQQQQQQQQQLQRQQRELRHEVRYHNWFNAHLHSESSLPFLLCLPSFKRITGWEESRRIKGKL